MADGDTVTVLNGDREQIRVRLYGIDAPERGQPWGGRATDLLRDLAAMETVEVEELDRDRWGRVVAILHLPDGRTANAEMIRTGLAWVYARYCRAPICADWRSLENDARAARLGLWADPAPVPPWEWRRR